MYDIVVKNLQNRGIVVVSINDIITFQNDNMGKYHSSYNQSELKNIKKYLKIYMYIYMSFKYTAYGEYQCNHPSGKTIEHFYKYMDNATLEACTNHFYEKPNIITHFTEYVNKHINIDKRKMAIDYFTEYVNSKYITECGDFVPGAVPK